ncbi:MAG TPA: glycosyltransferase family 4 protein [Candidatus Paceibacterota bacterium]|nr:glycosyltransferase family 4 protein [Candidatus Paceibacterota bacterium]
MKIAYVTNARIPTEKAHGYQITRTCSEWKKLGHDVTLVVPLRDNPIKEDAFSFYGIEQNFEVKQVPSFDWIRFSWVLGSLAFVLSSRAFIRALSKSMPDRNAVIFSRDASLVAFFAERGYAAIYNAHNWPEQPERVVRLLSKAKGIVCNSPGTEEAVKKSLSLPTVVVHNAADPNPFLKTDIRNLRSELDLPQDKKIVTYVGHLYGWKGADMILSLAERFKDERNVEFAVIGGTKRDIARFSADIIKREIGNVSLLGFQRKELIPKYLAASDVLILPNAASTEESVRYTSPLKLFEYMAAGKPIVASDLPSIHAVLPPHAGFFAAPGDVDAFQLALYSALSKEGPAKADYALSESKKYLWQSQAKISSDFIETVCKA